MRKSAKRTIAVAAATIILLAGAGAAYAYWSAGGAGSGSATTGTTQALVAHQTSVVSNLRPGGTAQTLSGAFDNPNTTPTYVTSVTASIGSVAGGAGACTVADYTLANAVMTVGHEVAVGIGVDSWTGATVAFNNSATVNQDGCKGATVTLSYSIQ